MFFGFSYVNAELFYPEHPTVLRKYENFNYLKAKKHAHANRERHRASMQCSGLMWSLADMAALDVAHADCNEWMSWVFWAVASRSPAALTTA